jgi:hypothetical protein
MNWYETDNNRLIIADVIAKVWQDPQHGEALVAEPKKFLQEAGIEDIPEEIELKTVRNSPKRQYLVLPEKVSTEDYSKITASMQSLLPLSSEQELVIVQNTEHLQYFALPAPPVYNNHSLSQEELQTVSGGEAAVLVDVVLGGRVVIVAAAAIFVAIYAAVA